MILRTIIQHAFEAGTLDVREHLAKHIIKPSVMKNLKCRQRCRAGHIPKLDQSTTKTSDLTSGGSPLQAESPTRMNLQARPPDQRVEGTMQRECV